MFCGHQSAVMGLNTRGFEQVSSVEGGTVRIESVKCIFSEIDSLLLLLI